MADTWPLAPRLRPRARDIEAVPEALAEAGDGAAMRPRPRPEGLAAPSEVADAGQLRPRPRPEGLGQASEEVQVAATVAEALPLDETALIGLFDGPEGGSALLRLPDGAIVKVSSGGTVGGSRVVAISEDGVRLERGDRTVVLTMPG